MTNLLEHGKDIIINILRIDFAGQIEGLFPRFVYGLIGLAIILAIKKAAINFIAFSLRRIKELDEKWGENDYDEILVFVESLQRRELVESILEAKELKAKQLEEQMKKRDAKREEEYNKAVRSGAVFA